MKSPFFRVYGRVPVRPVVDSIPSMALVRGFLRKFGVRHARARRQHARVRRQHALFFSIFLNRMNHRQFRPLWHWHPFRVRYFKQRKSPATSKRTLCTNAIEFY